MLGSCEALNEEREGNQHSPGLPALCAALPCTPQPVSPPPPPEEEAVRLQAGQVTKGGGTQIRVCQPSKPGPFHCACVCSVTANWSPPGSSVPGISQARIPGWVAVSFCRGSSQTRDRTHVSCTLRQVLYHSASTVQGSTEHSVTKVSKVMRIARASNSLQCASFLPADLQCYAKGLLQTICRPLSCTKENGNDTMA